MSTLRRAVRNLGALTGAQILARSSGLVITALLGRHLGHVGFGEYQLCISFAGIFGVLARLGIRQIMLRDMARDPSQSRRYLGTAAILQILPFSLMVLVVLSVARLMGYEGDQYLGIAIMAFAVGFGAYENLFYAVLEAREQMHLEAGLLLFRQLIWVGFAVWALTNAQPYLVFLEGLAAAAALTAVVAAIVVFRSQVQPAWVLDRAIVSRLVKAGLPLAGAAILVDVYLRVDILMIDRFLDSAAVGDYGAAYRLIQSLLFISSSFFIVVFPVFSRLQAEQPDRAALAYRKSVKAISLITFPVCVGTTVLASRIMSAIYGSEFYMGARALEIGIWVVALQGVSVVMGRMLVALDRQRVILRASVVSVLVNIALNALLIPRMGIAGAALASVITASGVILINGSALRHHGLGPDAVFQLLRPLTAALLMGLVVSRTGSLPLPLAIGVGAVVYPVLCLAFRVLDEDDRWMLRSIRSSSSGGAESP